MEVMGFFTIVCTHVFSWSAEAVSAHSSSAAKSTNGMVYTATHILISVPDK